MAGERILIVDDQISYCEILADVLKGENYTVEYALDGRSAISKAMESEYDVIIIDLKLPDMDGIELMRKLRENDLPSSFIVITGFASIESAVQAMREGAYDYIIKPFNVDEVKIHVKRVIERANLLFQNRILREELSTIYDDTIVGMSPPIQRLKELITHIAPTDATVLIYGESGTGKELVARAIHKASRRADKPMIKVSCAALPESLLESELFGYEKGAFTGAYTRKPGKFELANGGTFFLDEIGDMSPSMQVKLLRVLQEKEFERLGGTKTIKVDVRIIAATNRNLREAIREKVFREDLFYRLSVIPIALPPLRNRKEDIPLLCEHFIQKLNKRMPKKIKGISDEAMKKLMEYDWPGNVRELENTIERAFILAKKDIILPENLVLEGIPINVPVSEQSLQAFGAMKLPDKSLRSVEKFHIRAVLEECGWNKSKAASILGIDRKTLQNKIKLYGINP
jgi:DNA-binding NtrC family response regulator